MNKGNHLLGEIEITRENLIFENQYIRIHNDDVVFPSGTQGTYLRVSPAESGSVCILPVTKEGKLVLIRTFRHAVRGWGYEAPKGGTLTNEAFTDAAARELLEETGLICESLEEIGVFTESPAVFTGKMRCYIAYGCRSAENASPESTEAIAGTREFSPEDYLSDESEDFIDAMTQLMVYKYIERKYRLCPKD